ncbi:MAG: hypothetical protein KAX28_08930 [Candidatus Marinimicrobia bacterium]|nr:hypothetical protein [Candidatus Neomarinimicrobiota bacterium]
MAEDFYEKLIRIKGKSYVTVAGQQSEAAELVYNAFWNETVPKESELPPNEIHIFFEPQAITDPNREMIAKKAVLYSKRSYFITPYTVMREERPLMEDAWGNIPSLCKVDGRFIDLIIEFKDFIASGHMKLIPGKALFSTSDSSGIREEYVNADHSRLLQVKLKKQFLVDQLIENNAVRLFLPHLKGVKSGELLKIRAEYHKQFEDFQRALSRLLKGRVADGDTLLYELIQEVDVNIRRLNENINGLRRKSWFGTMKLSIGMFPLVLMLFIRPEFADVLKILSTIIGTRTVLDVTGHFFDKREDMRSLKKDAFIVPWLLGRE